LKEPQKKLRFWQCHRHDHEILEEAKAVRRRRRRRRRRLTALPLQLFHRPTGHLE